MRNSNLRSSWASICAGVITWARAAASSIASGTPSRRSHNSPTADALLWEGATSKRRENVAAKLKEWGLQFHNATCTDDQLASNVVSELELRGVYLANTNHSVALISEWDTFYGRALPLTFAAELRRRAETTDFNTALRELKDGTANWPSHIYRFTYMRGCE